MSACKSLLFFSQKDLLLRAKVLTGLFRNAEVHAERLTVQVTLYVTFSM